MDKTESPPSNSKQKDIVVRISTEPLSPLRGREPFAQNMFSKSLVRFLEKRIKVCFIPFLGYKRQLAQPE